MLSQRAEAAALCTFAAKDFAGVLEARSPSAWDAVADVDNTAGHAHAGVAPHADLALSCPVTLALLLNLRKQG